MRTRYGSGSVNPSQRRKQLFVVNNAVHSKVEGTSPRSGTMLGCSWSVLGAPLTPTSGGDWETVVVCVCV